MMGRMKTLAKVVAKLVAWIAVLALIVMVTLGRSFVDIGGLWDAEAHQVRSLDFQLFNGFVNPTTWWAPWLNSLGNTLLFVPVGMLLAYRRRPLLRAALAGFLISLTIEVIQYVFVLGFSDVDDLLFNTLGAVLGVWFAPMAVKWVRG